MRIEVKTIGEFGKTISAKRTTRETVAGKEEFVACNAKIASIEITRGQVDQFFGLLMAERLWDEMGAPIAAMQIELLGRSAWTFTGNVGSPTQALTLMQANVATIVIEPRDKGALLSCALSWEARGDEVEDAMDLLGRTCKVSGAFNDGGQEDMFRGLPAGIESMEIRDSNDNTVVRITRDQAPSFAA